MEPKVTEDHIKKAKNLNACPDGVPALGTPIWDLSFDQLMWAENHDLVTDKMRVSVAMEALPELSDLIGKLEMFFVAPSGSGYGAGYGDGYSYGSGYGSGGSDYDNIKELL